MANETDDYLTPFIKMHPSLLDTYVINKLAIWFIGALAVLSCGVPIYCLYKGGNSPVVIACWLVFVACALCKVHGSRRQIRIITRAVYVMDQTFPEPVLVTAEFRKSSRRPVRVSIAGAECDKASRCVAGQMHYLWKRKGACPVMLYRDPRTGRPIAMELNNELVLLD